MYVLSKIICAVGWEITNKVTIAIHSQHAYVHKLFSFFKALIGVNILSEICKKASKYM